MLLWADRHLCSLRARHMPGSQCPLWFSLRRRSSRSKARRPPPPLGHMRRSGVCSSIGVRAKFLIHGSAPYRTSWYSSRSCVMGVRLHLPWGCLQQWKQRVLMDLRASRLGAACCATFPARVQQVRSCAPSPSSVWALASQACSWSYSSTFMKSYLRDMTHTLSAMFVETSFGSDLCFFGMPAPYWEHMVMFEGPWVGVALWYDHWTFFTCSADCCDQ